MRATLPALCILAGLPACVTEAECVRRTEAAAIDARRDAVDCDYDPDGLLESDCANFDRTPLRTYQGVFCSTASLSCIDAPGNEALALACFGIPSDTGFSR